MALPKPFAVAARSGQHGHSASRISARFVSFALNATEGARPPLAPQAARAFSPALGPAGTAGLPYAFVGTSLAWIGTAEFSELSTTFISNGYLPELCFHCTPTGLMIATPGA